MNKHAYLILAHNNWNILNIQIKLLDCKYNDIYLLVDKKSTNFDESCLPKCKESNLRLAPRRDIYWGEYSMIQAFLDMMKMAECNAEKNRGYSYYHFCSGTCLPIKTQRYIYEFCERENKNFVGLVDKEFWYSTERVKFYWPLLDNRYYRKHKSLKLFVRALVKAQQIVGVNRIKNINWLNGKDTVVYNGWTWASITDEFARYLVNNECKIREMFSCSLGCDELWIHTILLNTEFRNTIYRVDDLKKGSMRFIDWSRGKPYTWGQQDGDYEMLMNSPYLFARKFDENTNFRIVEKIYEAINNANKMDI